MAEGIIPTKDTARLSWAENMERNFVSMGASLGFLPVEIDAVVTDCRMLQFVILNALGAKAHSKAANAYKKQILGKAKKNATISPPPEFTQLPIPAVITMSGVLNRLQKAAARMKLSANYSNAIGELLQIIPSKSAAFSPNAGKPKAECLALVNGVVRIDWAKG
nr:hypothetical protein [Pyrinomonadaceae bacterium]